MVDVPNLSASPNPEDKPPGRKAARPEPSGPPLLHNLPFPPLGELFRGRDGELRDLDASLQGDGRARAIVRDLGGIGKTRLAVEYTWRFGARFKAGLWVQADSPKSLSRGLASLALLLGLPERRVQTETVESVLLWLQANPGWLLILDNADSREAVEAVLEILPRLEAGQVLITSRSGGWPAAVGRQELGTVSPEEAQAFLLRKTGGGRRAAEDDEARARELAERLEGLPLALEQAGACISRERLSFAEYLKAWDEGRSRALDRQDETPDDPGPVAATWRTSFDRLQPTAATLLRLMAFLAPEPIPVEMFEVEREIVMDVVSLLRAETGLGEDPREIQEALDELESYSLVSREGSACRVHRVVQEAVRSGIPLKRRKRWIEAALKVVNGYSPVPPDDDGTWAVWNILRPHAARIVSAADEARVTDPTTRLMNLLGVYLNSRGLYDEAEPLKRRALEIDEASFGEDHPRIAVQLNNLATLLQATDRASEAEPLMSRALAIDEASFGRDHLQVAIDLNNLATLLRARSRVSEAEPLMRRAAEIFAASIGPDHPRTRIVQENLGILLTEIAALDPTV